MIFGRLARIASQLAIASPLVCGEPAVAQTPFAVDCSAPVGRVAAAICADAGLSARWIALEARRGSIRERLSAAEAAHFDADRARFAAYLATPCDGPDEPIERCVAERLRSRAHWLEAIAPAPYPYLEFHGVYRRGVRERVRHEIDVQWVRFARPGVDFTVANESFAPDIADDATAEKVIANTTESMRPDDGDAPARLPHFFVVEWADAARPAPHVLSIRSETSSYDGQAHPLNGGGCRTVDLRTGRFLRPAELFGPNGNWPEEIARIVRAGLAGQFRERPGWEPNPPSRAALREGFFHAKADFCWRRDRLVVRYDTYVLGPYSSGPYEVDIPYSRIENLLRGGALRP